MWHQLGDWRHQNKIELYKGWISTPWLAAMVGERFVHKNASQYA